jgi:hypothetical protein
MLASRPLFGLHPDATMARYDRMGPHSRLKGEHVVALTARATAGVLVSTQKHRHPT